jgi:hypothetical protein
VKDLMQAVSSLTSRSDNFKEMVQGETRALRPEQLQEIQDLDFSD